MKHFVIDIDYSVPVERIEPHMEEHRAFITKGYELNMFLVSGAKEPRSGGIIVGRADTVEAMKAFISEDPLFIHQLANHRIIEFHSRRYQPEFEKWFML